ncbi:MAG: LOG family protein [Clostridia bacterium]
MKVFVACGGESPKTKIYEQQAYEIGEKLAQGGHTYIQGGHTGGLMGASYEGFRKYSKNIELIVPEYYYYQACIMDNTNIYQVKTIHDRLKLICEISDAVIFLAGGLGTLDEMLTCIESKRGYEHNAKLIILNTNGFYNNTLEQLKLFQDEGILNFPLFELFDVANSVDEVFKLLKTKSKPRKRQ